MCVLGGWVPLSPLSACPPYSTYWLLVKEEKVNSELHLHSQPVPESTKNNSQVECMWPSCGSQKCWNNFLAASLFSLPYTLFSYRIKPALRVSPYRGAQKTKLPGGMEGHRDERYQTCFQTQEEWQPHLLTTSFSESHSNFLWAFSFWYLNQAICF